MKIYFLRFRRHCEPAKRVKQSRKNIWIATAASLPRNDGLTGKSKIYLLLITVLFTLLTGCGQIGSLYLPTQPPQKVYDCD